MSKRTTQFIKTPDDIAKIRAGGKILAQVLRDTIALVKPGVSTKELNDFAEKAILSAGGRPSFLGYGPKYHPFPAGLCTSINDAVVHGVPSAKDILQNGDIIGLDIGMEYQGRYTDMARTVMVGKVKPEVAELVAVTEQSLALGIEQAKPGNFIGDIGHAVQKFVESHKLGVVRDLVGHGVGYAVHEDPNVPNYGRPGTGMKIQVGMVLALEPMVTLGDYRVFVDNDDWTIRTHDGSWSAHFENTIVITEDGPEIVTLP